MAEAAEPGDKINLEDGRYAAIRAKIELAEQTFTPSRPVQMREIFAGRTEQLWECMDIPAQTGLHGILYGDRGVGKTSIANMVPIFMGADQAASGLVVTKIECTSKDTFETIIRQVYAAIPVDVMQSHCGFGATSEKQTAQQPLADLVSDKASFNPKDVATVLQQISLKVLAILDEFDRLDAELFDLSSFTELIKITSDRDIDFHMLAVGVGETVEAIIGNHASIVRNLTQIKLGAMTDEEISKIISVGMAKLELRVPAEVVRRVVDFSCGYPHYTHLLCLDAARNAIRAERDAIETADLDFAVSRALSKAQESVRQCFYEATRANRQNIYKEVVQACAEVELDEFNTFVPKDLEKALSARLKRPIKSNQFGVHLINLCKPDRGQILVPIGERGRARYRFRDPLMRAYVRMTIGGRN